jgi:hypothetical protein
LPDVETNFWTQEYQDKGLKVIALDASAGDIPYPTSVADYFDYLGPSYPGGIETPTTTYSTLAATFEGGNPFPVDVVIDQSGVIQYVAREYDVNNIKAVIDGLL